MARNNNFKKNHSKIADIEQIKSDTQSASMERNIKTKKISSKLKDLKIDVNIFFLITTQTCRLKYNRNQNQCLPNFRKPHFS